LDTLQKLGAGPATKFIFPMEFSNLVSAFTKANGADGGEG
jgi:hypothetical protein